ncbi:diguanylate cyclase [Actinotalea sp. M2MS4P-6]|uniref:diguanylate cyclase domain-containing protein n=1 Tax=Actinotalea sp. M2MS4P-6 TaxID=2983762 RepID=UPI0021E4FFB7|nr:diguanylate cyclase [Actinotalea sp. M2MS4P-6]MCV2396371.1 diguanylate cyclase [Actinotalea sp. M2MS4P-6]
MSLQRSRLRWVVIGASVALMLLVQLVAAGITGSAAERTALDVAADAIDREGETTVESVLRHLDPAEQSVEVTARLIAGDLLDLAAPGLERYLYTQLAVMPQTTGIFVGYPDGAFVFVTRDGDGYRTKRITTQPTRSVVVTELDSDFDVLSVDTPQDEYDPRERPWYGKAVESDDVTWTDPYVFFTSGHPGVTASRAVVGADGAVDAVVGVDVELSGLTQFIDELAVSANGEAFIVSGDTVVAAPSRYTEQSTVDEDGSLRLLTTSELGIDTLVEASSGVAVTVTVMDGERQLVRRTDFPADNGLGWSAVIRAPQSDFTEAVRQQQRAMTLVWLAGAVVLALAAVVMFRVTRPLRRLQDDATLDPLTGVVNRRALAELGARVVADAARRGQVTAVLVIDLDDFKSLNDARGHAVGDEALRGVGDTLRELTRPGDVVGRLGGDEFVVVSAVADAKDASGLAQRVVDGVTTNLRRAHPEFTGLGASAGLCVTAGHDDFDLMLRRADEALIAQKSQRKGRVRFCATAAEE